MSLILQVENDRLLPSIQPDKICALALYSRVIMSREVSSLSFDLYNFSTFLSQRLVQSGAATACSKAITFMPSKTILGFLIFRSKKKRALTPSFLSPPTVSPLSIQESLWSQGTPRNRALPILDRCPTAYTRQTVLFGHLARHLHGHFHCG